MNPRAGPPAAPYSRGTEFHHATARSERLHQRRVLGGHVRLLERVDVAVDRRQCRSAGTLLRELGALPERHEVVEVSDLICAEPRRHGLRAGVGQDERLLADLPAPDHVLPALARGVDVVSVDRVDVVVVARERASRPDLRAIVREGR